MYGLALLRFLSEARKLRLFISKSPGDIASSASRLPNAEGGSIPLPSPSRSYPLVTTEAWFWPTLISSTAPLLDADPEAKTVTK